MVMVAGGAATVALELVPQATRNRLAIIKMRIEGLRMVTSSVANSHWPIERQGRQPAPAGGLDTAYLDLGGAMSVPLEI